MTNKLVEDLGNGLTRTRDSNAPAIETRRARFERLETFFTTIAPNLANQPIRPASASTGIGAGAPGKVVGFLAVSFPSVGSVAVHARVVSNGVTTQSPDLTLTPSFNGRRVLMLDTPIPFDERAFLSMRGSTSADSAPNPLSVEGALLIEWDP